MASPFRIFRKYQKTLLAIAGVVLMFVFVVGDSLFSYLGGGRNAAHGEDHDAKATAVHWDGGKLTNRDLNELVTKRRILNRFLQGVEMEGQRPSAEAGVEPPALKVQRLLGPETPQQGVEASVVKTKLLSDAASESGMKVSDDAILKYLNELGRKNVGPDKMRAMLGNAQINGGRLSVDYVIEALREEMLAHNYRLSHEFAFETVTPQQRWKDWNRVNDRVVIEAAAVPAEMYMPDVKEPTEAELMAYFEKYKDRGAMPDFYGNIELPSATPGFRVPRKIDLQFIEASYDEFLTKAEAKISDEEVAKYYEEHKDMFVQTKMNLSEDKGEKKDRETKDAKPPAEKPEEKKDDAKPADAEKKADTEKKADGEKPAEAPAAKTDAAEKKDTPPDAKDEKAAPKSDDAKKSSNSATPAQSVFRLTAFAQDEKKDAAKDAKPADAEKKAEAPAAKADAAETKPAPPANAPASAPVLTPPAPPAPPDAATPDATKGTAAAPAAAAPAKPVEYQPLAAVKDEIRKRLAETKVAEELSKLTGDIQGKLDSVYNKWRFSDSQIADPEKKDIVPPPATLTDFASIAATAGLKSGKTGPLSLLELRETPVGKSSAIDANRTLLAMLFTGKDLEMYQPIKTLDIDGNRFVVMKISDTPGKVPTFAEAKAEVIKAWKKQQAAELAQTHATEFAKKAEEAKSPLATFFADNKSIKVVRTDPFSELSGGDVSFAGGQMQQQPYRFSQPTEIIAAGPDFLRRVFELKDGQVAAIQNNNHSDTYVVRIVEHQPTLAELRNNYLADAFTWYGENMMNQMHRQEIATHLDNEIELSSNLKWDRIPDKTKGEQADPESDAG